MRFAHETPAEHPSISQKELHYIHGNLKPGMSDKVRLCWSCHCALVLVAYNFSACCDPRLPFSVLVKRQTIGLNLRFIPVEVVFSCFEKEREKD